MSTTRPVYFLFVDDREENLLALEALLRREGVEILKARSGPEALELLLVHEVGLALIDVQMPGMDGFELAELMRGTARTRRVPIIFVTAGSGDVQRRFRGYEAGAVDFLTKPIEPDVLRSKAEVFFELARQRDELRAAAEENARLVESLRDADRRKDEFLAVLAHELRNPLAPIRTGLQLLRMAPAPEVAPPARDVMERQLTHMVRLIDDLLDVSRISRGRIALRRERVTVRSVVDLAVEGSRPFLEAGRHTFLARVPEEPLELEADPTRMAQVISNLLTNAARYTPSGGRIELTVERDADRAVIRVTDNGLGIPPEMLPKVWEMFTQVNRKLERSQGGLGIGLSLVRRLVELHGGTATAESEGLLRGSTFTVRVPLATTPAARPPSPDPVERAAPEGRRILVVDDNVDAAESLSILLQMSGHEVRTAHDGEAALAMVGAFRPEVVFCDIGMPGMDGYEVARRLRALEQGPRAEAGRAVLVALTGWGSADDKRLAREAGFDHHLTKPIEVTDVEATLREAG